MSEQVRDFFRDAAVVEDPFSYYEHVRDLGPVWREPYHGISDKHHGPPDARRFDYTPTYILRGVETLHLEFERG